MKKYLILIAGALLLAGCSAPAAAPAESPAAAAETTAPAAAEKAVVEVPAVPAADRMTTGETCAALNAFYAPHTLPGGGNEAERQAVEASIGTLPEKASEDLKEAMPAVAKFMAVSMKDSRNDTRELDAYMADPAVAEEYRKSLEVVVDVCDFAAAR